MQTDFEKLRDSLVGGGVHQERIFGDTALMLDRKVIVVLIPGFVAFRLGAGTDAELRAQAVDGSTGFDPTRKGSSFKGWVALPESASHLWRSFALEALDFVTSHK